MGLLSTAQHCRVEVYDLLPSTNLALKERTDESTGLVIVADHQSAGIGRLGRNFHSPEGTGLYFSLLIKLGGKQIDPAKITAMAAVAVCRAIESVLPLSVRIKWVNDIFLGEKKVCGILAQGIADVERGGLSAVILGIGVNVYEPLEGFPKELRKIAAALTLQKQEDLRNRLLAAILNEFFAFYEGKTDADAVLEYRKYCFLQGMHVMVHTPRDIRPATVLDVDDEYHLVVRFEDDHVISHLHAGEISIRF